VHRHPGEQVLPGPLVQRAGSGMGIREAAFFDGVERREPSPVDHPRAAMIASSMTPSPSSSTASSTVSGTSTRITLP